MPTKAEIFNAILKGLGMRPTSFLLRWCPSFKNPFKFDLIEVAKCKTDGGIVTRKLAQSPRAVMHLGHHIESPKFYSLFDCLKVQLRIIR